MAGPIIQGFDISHGEVMMKTDAYKKAGGYRTIFNVGQATDLFRRMSRLGDFGYLQNVLYERHLVSSGVNSNISRLADRKILSAMSDVAHRRAISTGDKSVPLKDDLDIHGPGFVWTIDKDRRMAMAIARASVLLWYSGDWKRARQMAVVSLRYGLTRRGIIAYAAIVTGRGPLRRPIQKAFSYVGGAHGELSYRRLWSIAKSIKRELS